ncbi:SH3 domain-containing protein [Paenibacillus sp. GCM10027626]|uniref:C40 family peptidase n=1 Tax=Paenibacillus sp. GCM10027626 TaxID=3273411 RepID=UPI0036290185
MKNKLMAMTLASILAASISLPAITEAAQQTGEIKASVSFREGPSTDSKVMRYLSKGEDVTVLKEVNSYWYQVQDQNGQTGYVSTSDKYITVGGNITEVAPAKPGNSANATAVSSVSFRKSASVSGARIRYLSKGEAVTILGQPNSYWYEIADANGVRGYVSSDAKYIKVNNGNTSPGGSGSNGNAGNGNVKPPVNSSSKIEAIIKAGHKYLGTPYEYGSDRNSTKTFDCSDFVRRAFIDGAGITLPSDSRQQGDYVKKKGGIQTNWRNLKRGDLMFFMSYKGTSATSYNGVNKSKATITHVGIYLGDGQIIHTYSKDSGGVRIDSIAGKHWEYRFMFGGSAL